ENVATFDGMFVVTAEKRMTIPEFPNGFTLVPGARFDWTVETHGTAASVDDLAGPTGFIDAWAPFADAVASPRRGDGTFAQSTGQRFTTVP
ncbi:MAG TPA: hypothetical protein VMS65_13560, partial [Polyangiaceae bacterium]|nr:hypothetical protein [Polyangiaceae bacterium]